MNRFVAAQPILILRIGLAVALAAYLGITAVLLWGAAVDRGSIVYSLDDVYIHMAIAKNLIAHGVWGVTPWEVTSASSSPLWVALLALGFTLLGPVNELPLIATMLSCVLLLLVAYRALREAMAVQGDAPLAAWIGAAALLAIALFGSLPALSLQGMEHPLHAAALLMAALMLARLVASRGLRPTPGWWAGYVALMAALPLLRYESLWLAVLGAALLLWRRRWAASATTLLVALLPVIVFGLWMVAHGNSFLPGSIMSKSVGQALLPDDGLLRLVVRFTWHPLRRLWSVPLLFAMVAVASVVLAVRLRQLRLALLERPFLVLLGLFVLGSAIHATFATFGWGSRYEAYLIALGIVALASWAMQEEERAAFLPILPAAPPARVALCLIAAAVLLYAGGQRFVIANRGVATHEVRDRDLYIAHFLAEAYPQQGVVAMNIGAVSWIGEPHLTDVLALGTPQMLRLFMQQQLTPQSVDALARQRGAKIAVVFDDWFEFWTGGPAPWIPVAQMHPGTERPLDYTLYVLDRADAAELARRLQAYQPPPGFHVTYQLLPQAQ
jgi:hypothetical protein